MDSTDDDFGELYVDVKVQATDAKSCDCEESESAILSDKNKGFEGTSKPGSLKKLGVVAKDSSPRVEACAMNQAEENAESDYSDSDDDLNIVLKDDDSKALPVASVSNTNNGGYASAINACIDPSLGMLQCGYSFSHPWSGTTFDVNFDMFEKKPWRNPGTDISDFFNFGLNEQSWKDYCKPLGRAIEVESGTLERIPSADSRRPRDSDPDVVIQIPVTNDVEELSSMTPVEARSPSITSNEAYRSEASHSKNGKDLKSFDDSIKDGTFVGCQDKDAGSFSGEQSPPSTKNCCSREVRPCEKEMIEEEKEEIFWNSNEVDPSSVESESSLGDRIRLSPTSSCSVSKNEESEDYETDSLKDSATDDQREVSTPPRRARLAEHEAICIRSGDRSDTRHSRHRRSHEDSSKRLCGRADYAVHGRIKHRIVKDASHTPDADLGKKVRSRHGSLYRDSNKNWHNGPCFTLERDETEGKGLLHSNREKCHGRLYSSVDHARHREHRFGWYNNKESSQSRGFDHYNGYKYEARLKEYTSRSSFNVYQRNYRSSFKEEDGRSGRHHPEINYGHERSSALAYESNKERNRYDRLREPYYQDSFPLNGMEYRYQLEYSSAYENPRKSHENDDLHSRRNGDYEYNFHRHRYEDGDHRAESGIPFELAYREMHSFAAKGRKEFQGNERYEGFSEIDKRHHYTPDWHLDRFVSEKDGYKYRIQDAWPAPPLSLRDYTKGSRGDSWRDDTRDFTTTEAYDRQNNQLYKAAPRDGWTRNLVHSDYVSIQDRLTYDDDWVRCDRGRYQLADGIECSMREVTHSEHPSYTDEILVRDIRMPIHNRLSTKQRSGYFNNHIHEIDERHHRSKKLRGDGNAFIECQDPINLTGRQGKFSNQRKKRFSNGGDTIEQQDRQKARKLICRSNEKAVQIQDLKDKEEGEIIEEARNVKDDDERIQESMKKMVKRRERFKETELAKTVEATLESQTEPRAKTDVTNQQRPVRKRRWCAS